MKKIKLLQMVLVEKDGHYLELSIENKFDLVSEKIIASEKFLMSGKMCDERNIMNRALFKRETLQSCKKCQSSLENNPAGYCL